MRGRTALREAARRPGRGDGTAETVQLEALNVRGAVEKVERAHRFQSGDGARGEAIAAGLVAPVGEGTRGAVVSAASTASARCWTRCCVRSCARNVGHVHHHHIQTGASSVESSSGAGRASAHDNDITGHKIGGFSGGGVHRHPLFHAGAGAVASVLGRRLGRCQGRHFGRRRRRHGNTRVKHRLGNGLKCP